MKKKKINEILKKDIKRRNIIILDSFIIVFLLMSSLFLCFFFFKQTRVQYVKYKENGTIDYKVFLKENSFYEDSYLDKNNQYIASLIDKINANFNYYLELDRDDVEVDYSYYINAEVIVSDKKTNKNLFKKEYELLPAKDNTTALKKIKIQEEVNINYNQYNDLIRSFISTYGIDNVNSILKINMYVITSGNCNGVKEEKNNSSVMSLEIPLTEKTIGIDITSNLINKDNDIMFCEKSPSINKFFLILAVIIFCCDILILTYTINYIRKTRSDEEIYERELKKILNNYGSYIQQIDGNFVFEDHKVIRVNNFNEMLEIRDTVLQPILMSENKVRKITYFIIPTNTNLLYVYRINMNTDKKSTQK